MMLLIAASLVFALSWTVTQKVTASPVAGKANKEQVAKDYYVAELSGNWDQAYDLLSENTRLERGDYLDRDEFITMRRENSEEKVPLRTVTLRETIWVEGSSRATVEVQDIDWAGDEHLGRISIEEENGVWKANSYSRIPLSLTQIE